MYILHLALIIIIIIHIYVSSLMVITLEALWPGSVLVRVRKGNVFSLD